MRVLFLSSNPNARPLADWLASRGGIEVVHAGDPVSADEVRDLRPEVGVSYNYRHIVKPAALSAVPRGILNLHISLLPFNRGAHPNVWSFLEGTPSGVTIHLMDEGVDTGPILAQRAVRMIPEEETLASSYARLHDEIQRLFAETWDDYVAGRISPRPQDRRAGTRHRRRDFEAVRHILEPEGFDIPIPLLIERYRSLEAS